MSVNLEGSKGKKDKKPRHRSPNYPSVTLKRAVELTAALHKEDKTHHVPIATAHSRMGYSAHSSAAMQAEAALKAFGLLEVDGKGKSRKVAVSSDGDHIVREGPRKEGLLKNAALRPKLHRELWNKYASTGLPSDEVIKNYLVWERDGGTFTDDAATDLIKNFRETIGFTKLSPSDKIEDQEDEEFSAEQEENGDEGHEGSSGQNARKLRQRISRGGTMSEKQEEVFNVPEGGEIVLQFPSSLTPDTFQDFQDWLKIAIRKIGRRVSDSGQEEQQ
ncbi:MAG: hypothetical protein J5J06_19545 [Phycisphaerae bacterium]|nr:hypothetical protein [Phycisphaerae bacterium]